jgi:mgtE-like transporter
LTVAERFAAAPARLARRARRLFGYWRSERRTLRQGSVALVLSTCAGFVAGLVLGSITGTLEKLPGLLVLIPASVGMRGTIFGSMGARFGTGVAAGIFEPTLRRGSLLSRNVVAGILSALLTSFYLAGLAKLVASAFAEEVVISFWDLVTISVVGGVLASLIALVFTVGIAVMSFRRGWDLDAVSTPMVTAIGDMVTLPCLFLATLLVGNATVGTIAAVLCTAATAAALIAAFRVEVQVRRILLEMIAIVALAPLLDILAGALLEAHRGELQAVPAVLILIPPFVSQAGALGGILSSRLSSKLQLGVMTARGRPEIPAVVDGAIVIVLGVLVFTAIGAVSWALSTLTDGPDPGAALLIGATLLAGAIVLPITLVVGYYVAVLTSRFGIDPDNQGVPFITSLLDLAGVAAILLVMRTSGVLP